MRPSLALTYDSSNTSSGWVGQGWSLSAPSIAIDTRFGVPVYDGAESYVLNGASIVWAENLEPGVDRFEPRALGSHLRILRRRMGSIVRWEVIEPSGTTTYYGESASGRLTAPAAASAPSLPPTPPAAPGEPASALYRATVERTAQWFAERVVDIYGNTMRYEYSGRQRPPDRIQGTLKS